MVGRRDEIQVIDECLRSGRSEFIVVYGRRRIGKTYLVKEYFNNCFSFYATGVPNINTRKQLKVFKEALVRYGDTIRTIPKDWFEAFSRLEKVLSSSEVHRDYETGRRVVFLDELPWMDTARSDFKSALDYFWNNWASAQKDLLLIVCGSATSWIIDNIVKDTGGLYNRITRQIHLMPFSLKECEQLLISNGLNMTKRQIVECYMVFGGVPYYMNYLRPQYSLTQNIEMLFFQENSPLRNEFEQLFAALFKRSDSYVNIVRLLSTKKGGYTRAELSDRLHGTQGKELTKYLNELEQCGFIRAYTNFAHEKTGKVYQLTDALSLFHLTFIEDNKIESWVEFTNTPAYNSWRGLAFERVCMLHINEIKQALSIGGVRTNTYAWRSRKTVPGAQIDLIIDRKDDVINICEMKFTDGEYAIDSSYERELNNKVNAFRAETGTSKALFLTMITMNGLKHNQHSGNVVNSLTAEDLFL